MSNKDKIAEIIFGSLPVDVFEGALSGALGELEKLMPNVSGEYEPVMDKESLKASFVVVAAGCRELCELIMRYMNEELRVNGYNPATRMKLLSMAYTCLKQGEELKQQGEYLYDAIEEARSNYEQLKAKPSAVPPENLH